MDALVLLSCIVVVARRNCGLWASVLGAGTRGAWAAPLWSTLWWLEAVVCLCVCVVQGTRCAWAPHLWSTLSWLKAVVCECVWCRDPWCLSRASLKHPGCWWLKAVVSERVLSRDPWYLSLCEAPGGDWRLLFVSACVVQGPLVPQPRLCEAPWW